MSFYAPHIFCCTNKRPDDHPRGSCGAKNAEALRQYLRDKLKSVADDPRSSSEAVAQIKNARANVAGCMDQCENGPVMVVYPEGVWYRAATTADIDRIVAEHIVGGKIVTDLRLTDKVKK